MLPTKPGQMPAFLWQRNLGLIKTFAISAISGFAFQIWNSYLHANFLLDAGIGGEITNLEDIANNQDLGSADLREAAKKAKGIYSLL